MRALKIAAVALIGFGIFLVAWAKLGNLADAKNSVQAAPMAEKQPVLARASEVVPQTTPVEELSDVAAKELAQQLLESIEKARRDFRFAVETGDKGGYFEHVRKPLYGAVKAWPEMRLGNRAIFPYDKCRAAALDFVGYADTFFLTADSVTNRQWREDKGKHFSTSYGGCKASIESPDMSLKDIR